jgi:hypothetical protein
MMLCHVRQRRRTRHRRCYLRYVARELELGVTSITEIGPLKDSFKDEQAAIRGLEGKLGAGCGGKGVSMEMMNKL